MWYIYFWVHDLSFSLSQVQTWITFFFFSFSFSDCSNSSEEIMKTDTFLVIFASVVLMCAFIIFLISYVSRSRSLFNIHNTARTLTYNHCTLFLTHRSLIWMYLSFCFSITGKPEKPRPRENQTDTKGSFTEFTAEAAGKKGLKIDLHFGPKCV